MSREEGEDLQEDGVGQQLPDGATIVLGRHYIRHLYAVSYTRDSFYV